MHFIESKTDTDIRFKPKRLCEGYVYQSGRDFHLRKKKFLMAKYDTKVRSLEFGRIKC